MGGVAGFKMCHRHSDSLKLLNPTMTAGKPCFCQRGGNDHRRWQKQGLWPGMGAKIAVAFRVWCLAFGVSVTGFVDPLFREGFIWWALIASRIFGMRQCMIQTLL